MLIVGISSPFQQSEEELKTDDPNRIKQNLRHEPGTANPNLNMAEKCCYQTKGQSFQSKTCLQAMHLIQAISMRSANASRAHRRTLNAAHMTPGLNVATPPDASKAIRALRIRQLAMSYNESD